MVDSEPLGRAIEEVVEGLLPLYAGCDTDRPDSVGPNLPNKRRVIEGFELLKAALLPAGLSREAVQPRMLEPFLNERLSRAFRLLAVEIANALPLRWLGAYARLEAERLEGCVERPTPEAMMAEAVDILRDFYAALPGIREQLIEDISAGYNGDPAALSYAEVMLCYPGLHCIASHRIAHQLYLADVPVVPRIMSEQTHGLYGIDIHPGAKIGGSFFMDHATGIVIGETAQVGDRVKLYQGVTLGAKSFPLDEQGHPQKRIRRHPTVEDDVILYANATILGDVTIGRGSEIGGNVFLMHSVPPGSRVRQRVDVEVRPPQGQRAT